MTVTDSRSAVRLPGREHIPIYPRGYLALRILQLVLACCIMGVTANVIKVYTELTRSPSFYYDRVVYFTVPVLVVVNSFLVLISLIIHSVRLHRHVRAGLPYKPVKRNNSAVSDDVPDPAPSYDPVAELPPGSKPKDPAELPPTSDVVELPVSSNVAELPGQPVPQELEGQQEQQQQHQQQQQQQGQGQQ
ncbi:hypothetical protein VTJ49DRAFT_2203 [Mycothermus thermophilus]|uniref:Uncharacterized protein n=1 Tax=Humicola insolens TaxID=85995 RepID=A0ABR3VAZ7_HUMIN